MTLGGSKNAFVVSKYFRLSTTSDILIVDGHNAQCAP